MTLTTAGFNTTTVRLTPDPTKGSQTKSAHRSGRRSRSAALQGCPAGIGRPDRLRQGYGGPPKLSAKAEGLRSQGRPLTRQRALAAAICLLAIVVAAARATAQEARLAQPQRPSVIVADFETNRTGWVPPPGLGTTLAELLTDRLVRAGRYRVVDRAWLSPTSRLQDIVAGASGAGVDYVVVGSVTRFSVEQRQRTGGGVLPVPFVGGLLRKSHVERAVGLTLRVVDVRTGEVVTTASGAGAASQRTSRRVGLAVPVKVPLIAAGGSASSGIEDRLLDDAVQKAITLAAAEIDRFFESCACRSADRVEHGEDRLDDGVGLTDGDQMIALGHHPPRAPRRLPGELLMNLDAR